MENGFKKVFRDIYNKKGLKKLFFLCKRNNKQVTPYVYTKTSMYS
jgi:hypothetical protein